MRRVNQCFSIAALFLCAAALYAQSDNGSIVGFVKDPSGAVIPQVKVTLKNEATGVESKASTNESGYYVVTSLQPGLYSMTTEAAGFKKYESLHNKLDPNATLSVDASLTVGSAAEVVEVTASAQALQTESAAVDKLVTRTQIDGLELNGRDPLFLASLQPGMRSGTTLGDFTFSLTSGGYAVNGARSQDTTITFDGAPAVRTRANGTSIGVADVDSTEEVQILTADYAAEYGRAAGGQIRIVTKGGSSQFHGAAYEYFRNSALNANTWSRNQSVTTNFASPFRYNQFGFNVGGPVIIPHVIPKGKMFFFVGQEWARYRNAQTQTQEVPSLLMRAGEFQRASRDKHLLQQAPDHLRSCYLPFHRRIHLRGFSREHYPGVASESKWHCDFEHVSDADARVLERQPELDRRGLAAGEPAQGNHQFRHVAERQRPDSVSAEPLLPILKSIPSIRVRI